MKADVVVAGGGLGGCAAALAALGNGLSVILIEETDWLGGQLTQQAVPPDENRWTAAARYRREKEMTTGKEMAGRKTMERTPAAIPHRRMPEKYQPNGSGRTGKSSTRFAKDVAWISTPLRSTPFSFVYTV